MYHRDRLAQHRVLIPQSLILFTCMYVCVAVYSPFCFRHCSLSVLLMSPPPAKLHPYCRSESDMASKPTAQHRAISSAQEALGIVRSLVASNYGPLLFAPVTPCCTLPCASLAGGISRPRIGALVPSTCIPYRTHFEHVYNILEELYCIR